MATANDIFELIDFHKHLLNDAIAITQRLLDSASEGDATKCEHLADNRERLVNLISITQSKIENLLNQLPQTALTHSFIDQLRAWQTHLKLSIAEITNLDRKIVELLQDAKDDTTKEIRDIFKSKEMFKGYNLTDVSR